MEVGNLNTLIANNGKLIPPVNQFLSPLYTIIDNIER